MTDTDQTQDIQRLRRYVTDLEAENALLRGSGEPAESADALRAENAELRRRVVSAAQTASPAGGGQASSDEHLTVDQAAQELNVSPWQVLRELRESLPLSLDPAGRTVVARADLDAYLLARAQGRETRRFL